MIYINSCFVKGLNRRYLSALIRKYIGRDLTRTKLRSSNLIMIALINTNNSILVFCLNFDIG